MPPIKTGNYPYTPKREVIFMRPAHYFFILLLALMIVSLDGISLQQETYAAPKNPITTQKPVVAQIVQNDSCSDATVLTTVKFEEDSSHEIWGCEIKNKTFSSGKNVDDWYVYTSTKDSEWTHPMEIRFMIDLDSEKVDLLAYEVYTTCESWPFLYVPKSGDEKNITPRTGNSKYYVHVNLLAPPSDGKAVKYTLRIVESWFKPPS
jgi:hypothetical protein